MKCFVIAAVLCSSLAVVRSAPAAAQSYEEKENKAIQECNATIPVKKSPRLLIGQSIVTGEPINLSQEEKCFMHCFLQKVGVLDENADIKNPQKLVNYTLNNAPEIAKYSDVLIAQIFQIKRTSKAFDHDKCLKAHVFYHQFATNVFTLGVAEGLQTTIGIKEKIMDSIQNGVNVDEALVEEVKQFLNFMDILFSALMGGIN